MTYCKQEGKDQIIFARHEDLEKPSSALIRRDEEEEEAGLILPSGEINWNCPCLGGMASGPCGVSFREAFSCFHFSKEDPKGSDCYQQFRSMQECMTNFPELYQENNKAESDVNAGDIKENDIHVEAPNVQIQTPEKR